MKLICPECKSPLDLDEEAIHCEQCSHTYPVKDGVPLLITENNSNNFGLAEMTFQNPSGYGTVVKIKRALFKDAELGTREFIEGKSVLDIGCGPSLNFEHLENHHQLAARYVGLDFSAPFVLAARKENNSKKYDFVQASASRLPFEDKSFDTVLISFTIHHVEDGFEDIIPEAMRVAKKTIIILDHIKSNQLFPSTIQSLYWKYFDGGCNYLTKQEWRRILAPLEIVKSVQTGGIFKHVIKFACNVS